MLSALFITLFPTLLISILFPKIKIHIKSTYLKIVIAWFLGIFAFTNSTFLIAILLRPFFNNILEIAVLITLLFTFIGMLFVRKDIHHFFHKLKNNPPVTKMTKADIAITTISLLFAYLFFSPHLQLINDKIFTSPIYWDYHWHMQIIHGFVYGDNIPPENTAYAGIPLLYHFFGDFVMAMYQSIGLNPAQAITYPSILFLFMLLLGIVGISEELFSSKIPGAIAIALTVTSSSGHFLYYFTQQNDVPILIQFFTIFTNTTHPWYVSHIQNSPFNYNGTYFNLFYFLEERHLLIGSIFLLISFWVIFKRKTIPNNVLVVSGICMGGFFLWHTYVTIYILLLIGLLLFFDDARKKTLYLFSGFLIIFALHYFSILNIIHTNEGFIKGTTAYPIFNFDFTGESKDTSIIGRIVFASSFYVFAYGLKLLLFPLGLYYLYRKDKYVAKLFFLAIIPIFIVINSLQIFASGVGENHKFLLNMNILVNLVTAYTIYICFVNKNRFLGFALIFFLTISGIIEHMPFINSKPSTYFADYSQTSYVKQIRNIIPRDAVTATKDEREFYLAGRKIFIGNAVLPTDGVDKKSRQIIAEKIYTADPNTFCSLSLMHSIDYVLLSEGQNTTIQQYHTYIATNHGNKRYLIDVNDYCYTSSKL